MNLRRPIFRFLLVSVVTCLSVGVEAQTVLTRVRNTTLRLPAEAPTRGYLLTNALGTLRFANPTMLGAPPGETNRLFVLERGGRVIVITNLAAPKIGRAHV